VDTILTRMGAYDNMFSNASTFKVELDEWYVSPHRFSGSLYRRSFIPTSCKILRDATPKSLVILDGESTRCGRIHPCARSSRFNFTQNSEGALRRTTGWRLQGYVTCLTVKGFELTSVYHAGCAAPTRDAHAVLIFLRDPLRFIDGRFRVPPQYPQYAHEDDVGR